MDRSARGEITRILEGFGVGAQGQEVATQRLFEAAYAELRRLAGAFLRGERRGHTLQPTALVHEAYLRLADDRRIAWQSRAHFFGIAARAMRQVLVEHARRRAAARRGGGWQRVTLQDDLPAGSVREADVLDLDRALTGLAEMDPRGARVVELRVFAGMSVLEVAHVLEVSERTVQNDWRVARMWLARELAAGPSP